MPTSRMPSREELHLWYEFCGLVEPDQWPNRAHPLRPKRRESFDRWLKRNWEDFELIPTHGLVEHKSPKDFKDHFIEGFYEFHISVNLYAPKAVIYREFDKLLNERHEQPGSKEAAGFMFNAPVHVKSLKKVIAVLRATRQGLSQIEIAERILGKRYKTTNAAAAAVSRDRRRGEAILDQIPSGRFPDPTKPAGDWGRDEPKAAIRHVSK